MRGAPGTSSSGRHRKYVLSRGYTVAVALTSATYWTSVIILDQLLGYGEGSLFQLYCGTALTTGAKFINQLADLRSTQSPEAKRQLLANLPSFAGSTSATIITPIWGTGLHILDLVWLNLAMLVVAMTMVLALLDLIGDMARNIILVVAVRGLSRLIVAGSFLTGTDMSVLTVVSGLALCLFVLFPAWARYKSQPNTYNRTVLLMEAWGNTGTYVLVCAFWLFALLADLP